MINYFGYYINTTVFDISFDVIRKSLSIVVLENQFLNIFDFKMTNQRIVTMIAN